jgi:hypothetical protein
MSAGVPVDILEKRAADQRRELQNTVSELRQTVRERLDLKRSVRNHIWPVAGAMVLLGLVLGYSLTGVFTGK